MARILIGNIKGPKGDTGPQGPQGGIGPVGPQGPLPPLVNNALATTPGIAALDAVMGKTLQDQVTQVNSNLTEVSNELNKKTNNSSYPLVNRGQITGDLNRLDIAPGYYTIGTSTSITNGTGSAYCVFVAFDSPYFVQLIADSSGVRCRKRTGNPPTWGGWG